MSIYWFSRAGPAASVRIYYEVVRSSDVLNWRLWQVTVPVGISFFPKELGHSPRALVFRFRALPDLFELIFDLKCLCRFLRAESNVVFESEHDVGGHFAAYEQPEALVDDLRRMFGKEGPAAGVVPKHDGLPRTRVDD